MINSKTKLQDLLNKCDENVPMSKEVKEWDQVSQVGKEYGSDEDQKSNDEKIECIELVSKLEGRKDQQ